MRALVTGGAGFIGSALVRTLVDNPRISDVLVFDNFSTGSRKNVSGYDIEIIEGDIRDKSTIESAVNSVDSVVHLAALPSVRRSIEDPQLTHDINVNGTLNVLEACRKSGVPIVAASSSSVYGSNRTLPKTESLSLEPMSPYAVSKLTTEAYVRAYCSSMGVEGVAFRFFNVYGPRQPFGGAYSAVIPAFFNRLLNQQPLEIHGDGLQTRDFTFVESVAKVLCSAVVEQKYCGFPVNLAFGTRTSLVELGNIVERISGVEVGRIFADARLGDVRDSQADPELFRGIFPEAFAVPLEEGLAITLDWFKSERVSTV